MGTYVSREFSLTTEFTRTYVRTMYCEISVQAKWREIQKSPKPPTMVFLMGSHHGISKCPHVVHHIRSHQRNKSKYGIAILMVLATHINDSFLKYLFS